MVSSKATSDVKNLADVTTISVLNVWVALTSMHCIVGQFRHLSTKTLNVQNVQKLLNPNGATSDATHLAFTTFVKSVGETKETCVWKTNTDQETRKKDS